MQIRTLGWRAVPAAVIAGVLAFGVAGIASAQIANRPPTPQNDTATTAEDTPVTIAVLANDTDPDGNALTLVSVDTSKKKGLKGTATISGNSIVYTPKANDHGTRTFSYTVSDGSLTASATVTVTITPVNDPPTARPDQVKVKQGAAKTIHVLANDRDVDGDTLTITSVTTPAHGTAVITEAGRRIAYTPTAGYLGADTFNYVVSDGSLSAVGSVQITVVAAHVSGTSAKVVAACQANTTDASLTSLCSLYLGGQMAPWATERLGHLILKRAHEISGSVEAHCAATGTDATLTALCTLYVSPSHPAWLKQDLARLIQQYVKTSARAAIADAPRFSKEHKQGDRGRAEVKQKNQQQQSISLSSEVKVKKDKQDRAQRDARWGWGVKSKSSVGFGLARFDDDRHDQRDAQFKARGWAKHGGRGR